MSEQLASLCRIHWRGKSRTLFAKSTWSAPIAKSSVTYILRRGFRHERICEFGSMSSYCNIAFQALCGLLGPLALRSRNETNYLYDSST
jgi:hypothetical protein